MIRGVNRQIIEINETGNKYFERALLFVSSDGANKSTAKLAAEANQLISSLGRPPEARSSRKKMRLSRRALVCAVIVLSVTVVALVVFNLL